MLLLNNGRRRGEYTESRLSLLGLGGLAQLKEGA